MVGKAEKLHPTALVILNRIAEGAYQSAAAQRLELDRRLVHYHVKRLKEAGYIRVDRAMTGLQRDALGGPHKIKIYTITTRGQKALQDELGIDVASDVKDASRGVEAGVKSRPLGQAEVHGWKIRLPIVDLGNLALNTKYQMTNWMQKWEPDFFGCDLQETSRHLFIWVHARAPTIKLAEDVAIARGLRLKKLLERHFHCRFGDPDVFAEYGPGLGKAGVVGHPLADFIAPGNGTMGQKDNTPEENTVHTTDAANVDTLIEMAINQEQDLNLSIESRDLLKVVAMEWLQYVRLMKQAVQSGGPAMPDERRDVA